MIRCREAIRSHHPIRCPWLLRLSKRQAGCRLRHGKPDTKTENPRLRGPHLSRLPPTALSENLLLRRSGLSPFSPLFRLSLSLRLRCTCWSRT
jgi:hypothetical protein